MNLSLLKLCLLRLNNASHILPNSTCRERYLSATNKLRILEDLPISLITRFVYSHLVFDILFCVCNLPIFLITRFSFTPALNLPAKKVFQQTLVIYEYGFYPCQFRYHHQQWPYTFWYIYWRDDIGCIIRTMRERLDCVYPLLWITMFNLTLEGQFNFVLAQRDKNQWQVLDLFSSPLRAGHNFCM